VFVSDPLSARDGVLIVQLFDAATRSSAFAIFDALHVAAGPTATLTLRSPVHLGFHATFAPASVM